MPTQPRKIAQQRHNGKQRQRIPALRETAPLERRSKILRYCAFGVSDVPGVGAAPVGAAFFFFFFFGAALGCGASLDCWASAFEAVSTAAGTPKLATSPTRKHSVRREITCDSIGSLTATSH